MLAGALLGGRRGFLAAGLFVLLVAIGLPLLPPAPTRPQGGLAVFSSGSVGYLLAWPLGAAVTGWCTERVWERYNVAWGTLANALGGVLVVDACGILATPLATGLTLAQALDKGVLFVPGDLIKAIVAAAVAVGVRRAYPLARPAPARA
jgi:biotin transport system substrate-specific component